MPNLFDPIQLGAISVKNRIFMAPLTRGRSDRDHVPAPLMAEYYSQRAAAGLIISEATGISREGLGWPYAPGLWTAKQVEGWKPIVAAVHAAGGRIVAQLWHMGRIVHPSFLDGAAPVSSSAIAAPGTAHTYDGKQPYAEPRALEVSEIPRLLEDYRRATQHALDAGFDGVQLHAANGYLIDQFLRDSANKRSDAYGGPVANRLRLLDEVTRAIIEVAGADRTGVRLSPNGDVQGVNDSDPHTLFVAAAELLNAHNIAFLELREPAGESTFRAAEVDRIAPKIRKAFAPALILNSDFTPESAAAFVESNEADAISFGRPFISNPDLVERIRSGAPLAPPEIATFYSQGAHGYTDYPALQSVS